MALYIPHSIFHLARLLYVRPETFGPYYVYVYIYIYLISTFLLWARIMYVYALNRRRNLVFSSRPPGAHGLSKWLLHRTELFCVVQFVKADSVSPV